MVPQSVRRCITSLGVILSLAATARGQSLVYVLDEGTSSQCVSPPCHGPTVHLFNAETGHDFGSIEVAPLGRRGTSVHLSSDGSRLFVTHTFDFDSRSTPPGQLSIVDALSRRVLAQVPVGVNAQDVAILPDNSRAYVVNTDDNSVSVVDLSSFTVVATVPVQVTPLRIVAAPDGRAVYVTNSTSGTVSKISTATNTIAATIRVGNVPFGIDVSADGSRVFVANAASQSVSVIDAALDSVLRNIPAGPGVTKDVSAQSASRVYVVDDGTPNASYVHLLNAADGAVIGSVASLGGARLARDSSGTPTYVVDVFTFRPTQALRRLSDDGSSATTIAPGTWTGAAVLTDPCAFESIASMTVFGLSGGSGTLTIPAPPGCSWTIAVGGSGGLSIAAPLSGTGPATRGFSVAPSGTARASTVDIGRQTITIEQTIPRMQVELATTATQQQPFTIGGWAFEESVAGATTASDTGVDTVHVWAYPSSGTAPIFQGAATYGLNRADVAAVYGNKYRFSGFTIPIGSLPSGTYTLVFYAHSRRSNTFSNAQAVSVAVLQAPARIVIDSPSFQVANSTPFRVAGWAVDPAGASTGGPGVDAVHVYAYPESGGAPIFLGAAQTGIARPDVAAYLGGAFTNSGFDLPSVSLTPGAYTLVVYGRSTATGQFFARTQRLTIAASAPRMNVDTPATGTSLSSPFTIVGWALDLSSSTGTGVDVVQAWAYPVSGGSAVFVGTAAREARADVAAYVGSRFLNCGFRITGATLPSGTYDLVVFARSTVTGTFNNTRVVRITVQ